MIDLKEAIKTLFEEAGSHTACDNCQYKNERDGIIVGCYIFAEQDHCEWRPSDEYIDTLIDSIVRIVEAGNDH